MFECLLLAGSAWVTPVAPGQDARRVPVTAPVGLDSWSRPDVWSIPIYIASASDPLRRLSYSAEAWRQVAAGRWRRSGNTPEAEREIAAGSADTFPFRGNVFSSTSATAWTLPALYNASAATPTPPVRFHIPHDALPAPGPDGHLAVRQPDGTVLETYGTVRLASGDLVALSFSVTDPRRVGDGYENGQTASMLPVYLGLLDGATLARGRIPHALAVTLPAAMLAPAAVHPAYAFDRGALRERPAYAGTVPMGARLALAPGVLPGLRLRTPEGRAIARAMAEFGAIVVDRGGAGISLRVRRNGQLTAALSRRDAGLQNDLREVFAHLVVAQARQQAGAAVKAPAQAPAQACG